MFKPALTTLILLSASALAGPVADKGAAHSFSLESWANDIITDPEGTHHLSPGAASKIAINQTPIDGGALDRRELRCNTVAGTSASVADAVWCIDFLARHPNQRCGVGAGGRSSFCRHGLATIQGVSGKLITEGGTSSPCGNVARAAGRIMDKCIRGGTVQGENTAYGNGYLHVHIRRP
ncbi:uncharacterized protein B0J16DRAFT_325492 [Fusarium flagelliforme]|uniref:Uncharacterized protein n=1 Tax=Fusarium flagelliforme TaxID=2675880 RepID=A0A395MPC5_9HYPO|nr:uncharacterized protein B0J16DRAFT_325492 [Fusarium flagelliforme]KAH7174012.1 hypothetical protein B0J16DRAFT_325492 [Fusarium flagelliforme]RFN48939.1 hypothetical protein FIE12Z_6786 [Fusarium flagelliforme]